MSQQLHALRHQMAAIDRKWRRDQDTQRGHLPFGIGALDEAIDGGLKRGALHELCTPNTAQTAAAVGLVAGLLNKDRARRQRPSLWIRHTILESEQGALHAPGLASLGFDPTDLILVRAKTVEQLMCAGLEAVRCQALSFVILESWKAADAIDLTATRRLALAAEASGVTPLLLHVASQPSSSVATTRWQVSSARARPLAANAPGKPTFKLSLLRNRTGSSGQTWTVEWNDDEQTFQSVTPLSRGVVPLPVRRPMAASATPLAKTG